MWIDNCYYGYPFFGGLQNPEIVFGTTKRSYTIRIEEWLKMKHPGLDPLDADQLLEAGLDTIFKNMNLNVLSDQYKDTFIVQFLSQFYMNEIGQETTDYFRQNLNKIIQNHGMYIKSLYELAEKKYFVEYSYRTSDAQHNTDTVTNNTREADQTNDNTAATGTESTEGNKRTADTVRDTTNNIEGSDSRTSNSEGTRTNDSTDERNGKTSGTRNTDNTVTRDSTTDGTRGSTSQDKDVTNETATKEYNGNDDTTYGRKDTKKLNGTVTNDGNASETSEGSGSSHNTQSSQSSHEDDGYDNTAHTGTDTTNKSGSNNKTLEKGTTQTTNYNGDTINCHNTKDVTNTYDRFLDTPQNGLDSMGLVNTDEGYVEGNEGVEYLTNARAINNVVSRSGNDTTSYNGRSDVVSQSGSDTDTGTFSEVGSIERNTNDNTEHHSEGWQHESGESDGTTTQRNEKSGTTHSSTVTDNTDTTQASGTDNKVTSGNEESGRDATTTRTGSVAETTKDTVHGTDVTEGSETSSGTSKDKGKSHADETHRDETTDIGTRQETSTGKDTSNVTETGERTAIQTSRSESNGRQHNTEKADGNSNTKGTNNVVEEYYKVNRDVVFMSNDITDKIWELFDDCFMQVL